MVVVVVVVVAAAAAAAIVWVPAELVVCDVLSKESVLGILVMGEVCVWAFEIV